MPLSSIAKKNAMAITGLLLCGFLVAHLAGNFLILGGAKTFNMYAHQLISLGPTLYAAEIVLLLIALGHLFLAFVLTLENKRARGQSYYMKSKTGRGATFASSTMPYTGIVMLAFIVLHLLNFKYGSYYLTSYDGLEVRDLYRTVFEYFENPYYTAWYVFAMTCVGIHTSHGLWSAFQSLGFNHPRYTPILHILSKLYAVVIAGGFSFLSLWCHFKGA